MAEVRNPLVAFVTRFASKLRYPHLFLITASLFVLDLLIPDVIPFADEILLGLMTTLFASWKTRQSPAAVKPPEKDVTPR